ncbi:MAG: hypothetical protein KJ607_01765 [Bacteroidetes bacterium]|nr:hypothetical protein [Bacteroidota bacterium]
MKNTPFLFAFIMLHTISFAQELTVKYLHPVSEKKLTVPGYVNSLYFQPFEDENGQIVFPLKDLAGNDFIAVYKDNTNSISTRECAQMLFPGINSYISPSQTWYYFDNYENSNIIGLIKLSPDCKKLWRKEMDTVFPLEGFVFDRAGNYYLYGYIEDGVPLPENMKRQPGKDDNFCIAKFSSDGRLQWVYTTRIDERTTNSAIPRKPGQINAVDNAFFHTDDDNNCFLALTTYSYEAEGEGKEIACFFALTSDGKLMGRNSFYYTPKFNPSFYLESLCTGDNRIWVTGAISGNDELVTIDKEGNEKPVPFKGDTNHEAIILTFDKQMNLLSAQKTYEYYYFGDNKYKQDQDIFVTIDEKNSIINRIDIRSKGENFRNIVLSGRNTLYTISTFDDSLTIERYKLFSENTGIFADPRDNKQYRTIKIGEKIWMAENLYYKMSGTICYENDTANCDIYGCLYTWNEAMNACPAGWHLASEKEFQQVYMQVTDIKHPDFNMVNMISSLGAVSATWKKPGADYDDPLKYHWTNHFGLSVLPGGYYQAAYESDNYTFSGLGICFGFWVKDTDKNLGAGMLNCDNENDGSRIINYWDKNSKRSVRCVKD